MRICVVGLGYVGLPLAAEFARAGHEVTGYDINERRVKQLKEGVDSTGEVDGKKLSMIEIDYTTDEKDISKADYVIVTVPTPITSTKTPDLSHVKDASRTVGRNLRKGMTVVYESTVYPGATQEDCLPILEKESGLKCPGDFGLGYSPERVNPGDAEHTIDKITKIVSGIDEETAGKIAELYSSITNTYVAKDIMTAEAAKVIENVQRDLNIALVNELSMIFERMDLETEKVLEAAETKWNFHRYRPGLVGGHCIPVDPYYLVYKARQLGHHPDVILAGRRINDDMARHEAQKIIKHMIKNNIRVNGAQILVLGATFKPDITDTRNSKTKDLVTELKTYGINIDIHDPHIKQKEVFGCRNVGEINKEDYDLLVKAVCHKAFRDAKADYTVF